MQTFTIGRNATNTIVLDDAMVSRQHAQLTFMDNGQVLIKDLGSSNGTYVNGNKVSECYLKPGDIVKVGSAFLDWQHYAKNNPSRVFSKDPISSYNQPSPANQINFLHKPINIANIKHEKEKTYFIIKMIFSCLLWCLPFVAVIIFFSFIGLYAHLFLLPIALVMLFIIFITWISGMFFKAYIYGHSVKINANQYPEIHEISVEYSERLGFTKSPNIFIFNSNGFVNAFAIKFLSKKYVLLASSLVDLMLSAGKNDELAMIIGHELGHFAAGHCNRWKNMFLAPSAIIPFLQSAYHRACELTADRIGFELTNNLSSSQNALFSLASGSERLSRSSDISSFMLQENDIPGLMGFIQKIFSSHPRTTKRIIEITTYNSRK